tara:strand:+ start:3403 stop:4536 length:1134 start_codon:yes stop_codon:yes gene_type:complete
MRKKIYYWGPFLDKVGTVRAIYNSAEALNKYSNEYEGVIINAAGEWDSITNLDGKINIIKLGDNYYKKLPRYSFIKSRFSYILIFLKSFRLLKKLLQKDQPDYLIAHLIVSLPMVLFLLFSFKTKLCLRISGKVKLNFFRKILWKISSKKINKIFCPTIETKNLLIREKIFEQNKVIVLRDPVIKINKFFKMKVEKNLISSFHPENIILIGRLTKQKNFSLFINAFSKIVQKFPDLKVNIFGEGELKKSLQKRISEYRLEKKIILHGSVDNIFKYLKKSKIFILTSLWEDPGASLMEAAFCNTLIVSSDCPSGPKEFLLNGKGGFLFKNNSETSLINSIESAINCKSIEKKKMMINVKKNLKPYTFFNHYTSLRVHL